MDLGPLLYLLAPLVAAGVAHAVVIRRDLLGGLAVPIDGGRTIGGRPVFGPNKTWRGPVVMALATAAGTGVQALLQGLGPFDRLSLIDYGDLWLPFGLAMSLAYSAAELPNSFVKRRLGVTAGSRSRRLGAVQYLADQADSAIGVTLVLWAFLDVGMADLGLILLIGVLLHAAFDLGLYAIGVKRVSGPAGASAERREHGPEREGRRDG